jgi:hypothetical protein
MLIASDLVEAKIILPVLLLSKIKSRRLLLLNFEKSPIIASRVR